jgi:uncharacterized protein (DUF2235 family)
MSESPKQRLAIFLDGTWNTEDDSTNVLNAYHHTQEGLIADDNVIQKRYYDRGVGTGVTDSLSGGGFGYGLEVNVREAYNWLVDNYNDGDEIYIFGFSRGAYTARSLVGLIAACGLVKRGAPLTVSQLWSSYAFISQHRGESKREWWEEALQKNRYYFRRISNLKFAKGDLKNPINKSEELVIKWSRRVDIAYLGIFDTVGAMGIQALGIPGLRSKLAENHNLNPSTIIKKCRHALAIDEHRSSFRLTPILDYVHHSVDEKDKTEQYKNRIRQRWFVGSHSNIGGGYANNTLSMQPSRWMLEGAKNEGLAISDLSEDLASTPDISETSARSDIRDSFAELAGVIWPHFIREKRNFRPIGRADLVNGGYTLRTINEEIDETVFTFGEKNISYSPPNLLSYLRLFPDLDKNQIFKDREPQQKWPGEILAYGQKSGWLQEWLLPRIFLAIWATLAAIGTFLILQLFWVDPLPINWVGFSLISAFYVIGDWGDSQATIKTTFYPNAVIPKVIWNVLYWVRWLGVFSFGVGFVNFIVRCIDLGWELDISVTGLQTYFYTLFELFQNIYLLPFLVATTLILILGSVGRSLFLDNLNESSGEQQIEKLRIFKSTGEFKNQNTIINVTIVLALLFFIPSLIVVWKTRGNFFLAEDVESLSGKLLLIYFLFVTFYSLFGWVVKPMGKSKANLGSIGQLQNVITKNQLTLLFESWSSKLSRNWVAKDVQQELAWTRLKEVLRTALWRDLLGFIPIYSLILGTVLYIGSEFGFCSFLGVNCSMTFFGIIPLWLLLIIVTALADVTENIIHLKHIKNHPIGGSSRSLIVFGGIATMIKFIGFFISTLLSLTIFFILTLKVITNIGEWRWFIATGISYIMFLTILLFLVRSLKSLLSKKGHSI